MKSIVLALMFGCCWVFSASSQTIIDTPLLTQTDSTTFNLVFHTDSAAVVTVHAAQDSTYRSAFIFFGRTIGDENLADIKLSGLRNSVAYLYRVFLGTELEFSGSFYTGKPVKK